ncbi:MAG: EAL domain-containing protein [Sulfurospirillaceae bacterium]|nr:EAL domain-containing protein [Sulfurospirillaceae bacterium]
MENHSSNKLLKMMIAVFIVGFLMVSAMLISIFTGSFLRNYNNSSKEISIEYDRKARIAAEDKIQKLANFINIYEKTLEKNEKQKVKNSVNFGLTLVEDIYNQYKYFPKSIIYQKIKDKLGKKRFFDNKTGYFFIYDLNGTCISLPTTPKLEGTNQINFKDGKNEYTIQKAIEIAKTKGEGFAQWYWYKIGETKMKKKIGFVKIFKPLNILIGAGRYEEDILNNIKNDIKPYLRSLDSDQYGYIFAYDSSGNKIDKESTPQSINRWNEIVRGEHIVRNALRGAQIIPEGFFIRYVSKEGKEKTSYVKLIPKLNWIVGTNTENAKKIYAQQAEILKRNLHKMIYKTILLSILVLAVMILFFLILFLKIQNLFKSVQKNLAIKNRELIEQRNIFETLFRKSHDGIIITKNRQIVDCNDTAIEMFEAKNKNELLYIDNEKLLPILQDDGSKSIKKLFENVEIAEKNGYVEFELKAKKFSGSEFWINISVTKIDLADGAIEHFALRDITKRKNTENDLKIEQQKLLFQAKHDTLTSLPNRIFLMDRLSQNIKYATRKNKKIAVVFLDIDNFKNINDLYGHDVGDDLLKKVASVLKSSIRSTDTAARLSGDEFIIVLDDLEDISACSIAVKKLIKNFQLHLDLNKDPLKITFSVGVSVFPNDATNELSLLKYADMAMYKAKGKGKNTYVFYDESMHKQMLEHLKIEKELNDALSNDEFILYYQPQIDINTGKMIGLEALIRWDHPSFGLLAPGYFINIAEESDLILSIGNIVIEKAMRQIKSWYDKGYNPGIVSVNLATKQLNSEDISTIFESLIEKTGCRPTWLEIEVLERYVMTNPEKSIKTLKYFQSLGIRIAIDDFGTGYSSMNYLKHLPITKLKIAKPFIDDIVTNKKDLAIAKSIIDLSKGLDLEVLAEGVETKEQYDILQELGCEIIQGYYFSKPVPPEDIDKILQKNESFL